MYLKIRSFVLNCELYGTIWSINTTCKITVSTVQKKKKWVMYLLYKSMEGVINTEKSRKG